MSRPPSSGRSYYRPISATESQLYDPNTDRYGGPVVLTSSLYRRSTPGMGSSPSLYPSSPLTPARARRLPLNVQSPAGSIDSIQSGGWGSIHSEPPSSPDRTGQLGPGNYAHDPNDPQYDHTQDQIEGWTSTRRYTTPTLPPRQVVPHPSTSQRDRIPPQYRRSGPSGPAPGQAAQAPSPSVVSDAASNAYGESLYRKYHSTTTPAQRLNWLNEYRRTGRRPVDA